MFNPHLERYFCSALFPSGISTCVCMCECAHELAVFVCCVRANIQIRWFYNSLLIIMAYSLDFHSLNRCAFRK